MGDIMNNKLNNDKICSEICESFLKIQEDERNRIARDLHDTTLQDLAHLIHKLELLGLYIESDSEKANLELGSIKNSLKKTINDIRNIIFDLRPSIVDDLGLKESFDVFFNWIKDNTNFKCEVEIDSIDAPHSILLNIYRIVVEYVLNAVKYSEGTQIIVRCKNQKDCIAIFIQDNGKGFNIDKEINSRVNHGLSIVKERVRLLNGNINFETGIGKGVKINITIPDDYKCKE